MRLVYVMNPMAGRGRYLDAARSAAKEQGADAVHLTERPGECIDYIAQACLKDPETHFVVYGGDGTAGEAATGIMRAGAGTRALLTIRPCGSGNDFVRGMAEFPPREGETGRLIDLISVNGRYVLNIMNIGFDCDVVVESERLRRGHLMPNSLSYLSGMVTSLGHKKTFSGSLTLYGVSDPVDGDRAEETVEGDFLLIAAANLPYYGGGFRAAPAADPSDGLMDMVIVRDIPRMKFLSLAGVYRRGQHINTETLRTHTRFSEYLLYRRCRTVRLEGVTQMCLDGEVIPTAGVHADIVPRALRIST